MQRCMKRDFISSPIPKAIQQDGFSISSTLNFEYLRGITNNVLLELKHHNQAKLSIEHAVVPAVFTHLGYKTYNLSIFDLAGHPALFPENFLVLPEIQMLLYNTLSERIRRDVLWHLILLDHKSNISEKEARDNDEEFARWKAIRN